MTRPVHLALMGFLGLVAVTQITFSLRRAMQLPPPPALFSPRPQAEAATDATVVAGRPAGTPATAGKPPATAPPSPAVATPDPANILRISVTGDAVTPSRMQAEARTRVQLMISARGSAPCVVDVIGPDGKRVARTQRLAPSAEETLLLDVERGRYRVRVADTDLEAELIGQ